MVKNISYKSSALLRHFIDAGKACFKSQEVVGLFHSDKESAVSELSSDMANRGLLLREKEGYIVLNETIFNDFMEIFAWVKEEANIPAENLTS